MKFGSDSPIRAPSPDQPLWRHILRRPSTRLGWWSVGLAATFAAVLLISREFMPSPGGGPGEAIGIGLFGHRDAVIRAGYWDRWRDRGNMTSLALVARMAFHTDCVVCLHLSSRLVTGTALRMAQPRVTLTLQEIHHTTPYQLGAGHTCFPCLLPYTTSCNAGNMVWKTRTCWIS